MDVRVAALLLCLCAGMIVSRGVHIGMRPAAAGESESAHWDRHASAFSPNIVVWLRTDVNPVMTGESLEMALRAQGLPLRFVKKLFGIRVLLFVNELGTPGDAPDAPFTVAELRKMIDRVRAHDQVRDARVDFVSPKSNNFATKKPHVIMSDGIVITSEE